MADKYLNFEGLASSEIEGRDYIIRSQNRGTKVIVIGPHAGDIEPGTSEIVLAIASQDLSYYLFEGTKDKGNRDLHVTSTKFNEPKALDLVGNSEFALAIHGEKSTNNTVYIGGRNQELQDSLRESIRAAGFSVDVHDDPELQGVSPANICNRCASGSGVQLELAKGLRKKFFQSLTSTGRREVTEEFGKFVSAIRRGLNCASAF
jgi:phage replication-related protein YjqB (UPF0714/DUF867 family)